MSFEVIITQNFRKEAKKLSKKYFSLREDLQEVIDGLAENPIQGNEIFKNCYKIRFQIKSKNKGISGGGRLITLVRIFEHKVFLLSVFDKSEMESVTDQKLKEILAKLNI